MIWSDPIVGEELFCERHPGNSSDPYAIAVKKQISEEDKIVGHVPKNINLFTVNDSVVTKDDDSVEQDRGSK